MAAIVIGWAVLAAPEPLYLDEAPPPVRTWSLSPLTVQAPVMVEAGALLVVDAEVPSVENGGCRHVSVLWQEARWRTRAVLGKHRAEMPVDLETPQGTHALWIDCDGQRQRIEIEVTPLVPRLSRIKHRGRKGKVHLRVAKRFGDPPPERVRREGRALAKAFRRAKPERQWSKQFLRPAAGIDTSAFGTTRVFRGVKSVHEGLDIDGGLTDAVYAANDGTVLLVSDDFFYIGNAVVIDHGEGLLTLYMHLETPLAKTGQSVKRGDLIGIVGATGRVTGPHLHFAVRYRGRYVDPNDLLRFLPNAPLPDALAGELLTPDHSEELANR